MLSVDSLRFSYGSVEALHGISLDFQPGRIACIIGRNGVGKTTLLRTLMGSQRASAGRITLSGEDVTALPAYRRARGGLALVPQGREIYPKLTVEENLRLGLHARRDGLRTVPDEIYKVFPVLGEMRRRRGGDLSGGQQQQLAIGRALAGDPTVILLDEPTEGIQPNVIQLIGQVLRKLAVERNLAIVLVEQYLDFVREIGDEFHIMDRGKVVASGPTTGLSQELVAQHLMV
jgi:urea transport system ATP-binding protein